MIETTRDQGGNLKTTTGAMPSLGRSPLGSYLVDMINKRNDQPTAADPVHSAAAPAREAAYSAPSRMPNLGAGPSLGDGRAQMQRKAPATRQRKLMGYQDPMSGDAWAGSKLLNPGTMITETQLDDGSWSGDAVYGTLSGNEEAARQSMLYQMGKPINT